MDFLSDIGHDQQEQQEARTGILERGREMISRMLGQTEEQVARPEFLRQQKAKQASLPPFQDLDESAS